MNTHYVVRFKDGLGKIITGVYTELDNEIETDSNVLSYVRLIVSGKNYNERKESARNLAIDTQNIISDTCDEGISWHEYLILSDLFETLGKRYGLTREFRENAII